MKGLQRDPERLEVRVLRRAVPLAGARVLEIGCGRGRLTRRLAGTVHSLVSIDSSPAEVARAGRLMPARLREKVHFEVGSAETLPFRDQSFQVVVLSWSL